MSSSTVRPWSVCAKISAIVALLLCASCAAEVGDERELGKTQQALEIIGPAPGFYSGRIIIGTTLSGVTKARYVSGLSGPGTCLADYTIDPNHNTQIKGTTGANEVHILGGSETFPACPAGQPGQASLRAFQPATMVMSVLLGSGQDWLYTKNRMPNLWVDASNGDDFVFCGECEMHGGTGDDVLIADSQTPSFTTTKMYGEDSVNALGHGDVMCAWAYIDTMDGGLGTDYGWWSWMEPLHLDDAEGHACGTGCLRSCPDLRVAGLAVFND